MGEGRKGNEGFGAEREWREGGGVDAVGAVMLEARDMFQAMRP